MNFYPPNEAFLFYTQIKGVTGSNLQLLSFYSTRHRPFIKQVHSRALTTILTLKEDAFRFLGHLNRNEINT
jgi:hypothetical protein